MSDPKDNAVQLLMHYFEQAGLEPTDHGDFRSEMEGIVESIVEAAVNAIDERRQRGEEGAYYE